MGSQARIRSGGRLVRGSDSHSQLEHILDHRDMDPQYATIDQLDEITDTMASIQDAILGLRQRIDGIRSSHCRFWGTLLHLHHHHHHHHLDPLYNRTIQFHLLHHHLFSQPHRLEHLYCTIRLRPYHILLWPPHRLLMALKPVSIGLSRGSGLCMFLIEL